MCGWFPENRAAKHDETKRPDPSLWLPCVRVWVPDPSRCRPVPPHPSITGGLASHVCSESSEHAGNSERELISWFVRAYVDLQQFAPCVSSPSGPTCAAPASTRTAVRAGRPCPGATSASSVSALQLSLAFSTSIHSKQIQTDKIPLLLSSNLQEFVWRWLLLQTQHVHVFRWAALPQLWIGSRSVTP